MEDPVVPLERNLNGHPLSGRLWERQFAQILWEHVWEKVPNLGMLIRAPREREDYCYLCFWMTSNRLERDTILIRCGKYSIKKLMWEYQHHSLIMSTWDVINDIAKHANILLTSTEPCSNPEFPQEQRTITTLGHPEYFLHGPTI